MSRKIERLISDAEIVSRVQRGEHMNKVAEAAGVSRAIIYQVLQAQKHGVMRGLVNQVKKTRIVNRATDSGTSKERNPIYLDREECRRCGSRDRKLCGH